MFLLFLFLNKNCSWHEGLDGKCATHHQYQAHTYNSPPRICCVSDHSAAVSLFCFFPTCYLTSAKPVESDHGKSCKMNICLWAMVAPQHCPHPVWSVRRAEIILFTPNHSISGCGTLVFFRGSKWAAPIQIKKRKKQSKIEGFIFWNVSKKFETLFFYQNCFWFFS